MDPWRILPDEQAKYDLQFGQLAPIDGFLTGQQARDFFFKSGLPPQILARVWELSDINKDGRLDKREFSIAFHLIKKKLQGFELPPALPPSILMSPSSGGSVPAFGSLPDVLPRAAASPPSMVGSMPGNYMGMPANISPVLGMGQNPTGMPVANPTVPVALPGYAMPLDGQRSRTGSIPGGPGSVPLTGEWAVPHPTKLKYNKIFHDLDKMRNGFLNGNQVRMLMSQSGLPNPVLAQIWTLADIDKDGRLTSEEFVLAMHLVETAKAREPTPTILPPELIPPSYRRPRGMSSTMPIGIPTANVADQGAALSGSLGEPESVFPVNAASFEDKRKENYDRGQAELERRRQAIAEMQRQEREEREKKEREEAERRERLRLEQERKRQEQLERELARQREIQEKQEEERRKVLEQREAARKEMERQRKIEKQKHRIRELINERTKAFEDLAVYKSENSGIDLHALDSDPKRQDMMNLLEESRNQVRERKEVIDGMRMTRDGILDEMNKAKSDEATLGEQIQRLRAERTPLEARLSVLGGSSSGELQMLTVELQRKKDAQGELQTRLGSVESSLSELKGRVDQRNTNIRDLRDKFEAALETNVRLLHDFQNKQSSAAKLAHAAAFPLTQAAFPDQQPAWNNMAANNLYPDLHSASTVQNGNDDAQLDNWADAGFEATEDVWEQSPFDQVPEATPAVASGQVEALRSQMENMVVRSESIRSIKHEHHLSFDNDFRKTKFKKYKALFAYIAGNEDELSFQPGDFIYVPDIHDGEPGWLPGELNGKTGWLPENHVQFVCEVDEIPTNNGTEKPVPKLRTVSIQSDTPQLDNAQLMTGNVKGKAIHPWNAKKETHLTFAKGEILTLRKKAENWFWGEREGGVVGWFPAACVEVLVDHAADQKGHEAAFEVTDSVRRGSTTPQGDGRHYVAVFDYASDVAGDLAFNAGELIEVTSKDGDWWMGTKQNGQSGIFPSNYVKPHQASVASSPSPSTPTPKQADDPSKKKPEIVVTLAAYTAGGPEQISFSKGDMIVVRKKTETGWWEGELQAKGKPKQVGWFPASYVKSLSGGESAAGTPATELARKASVTSTDSSKNVVGAKVTALYDYQAMNPDELSFKKGDVITIVNKEDDNWWKGVLHGNQGILPSNYVQILG